MGVGSLAGEGLVGDGVTDQMFAINRTTENPSRCPSAEVEIV
jgi:hypothetical protein